MFEREQRPPFGQSRSAIHVFWCCWLHQIKSFKLAGVLSLALPYASIACSNSETVDTIDYWLLNTDYWLTLTHWRRTSPSGGWNQRAFAWEGWKRKGKGKRMNWQVVDIGVVFKCEVWNVKCGASVNIRNRTAANWDRLAWSPFASAISNSDMQKDQIWREEDKDGHPHLFKDQEALRWNTSLQNSTHAPFRRTKDATSYHSSHSSSLSSTIDVLHYSIVSFTVLFHILYRFRSFSRWLGVNVVTDSALPFASHLPAFSVSLRRASRSGRGTFFFRYEEA